MLNRSRALASVIAILALATAILPLSAAAIETPTVNWMQLSPATSPSGRSSPAMTYDPVSKKVIMFGGFGLSGYLNDTWTFDGTTWTKLQITTAPPVRTAASMAWDKPSGKLILFGGYNGFNDLGDTWIFDGSTSTWSNANPAHSPKAVTGPALFTDPLNGHVDNYGGFDGNFYQLITYQWTGTDWKKLQLTTTPYARAFMVAASSFAAKSAVVFDGLGDVNPYNTWTWDGTAWTMQSPAVQPPSRYSSNAAYDPPIHAFVVFGGGEGGVDLNDTWAWINNSWQQLITTQAPPVREGHGMTYDPAIGHVIVFGGQKGNTFYNDTWELTPH